MTYRLLLYEGFESLLDDAYGYRYYFSPDFPVPAYRTSVNRRVTNRLIADGYVYGNLSDFRRKESWRDY